MTWQEWITCFAPRVYDDGEDECIEVVAAADDDDDDDDVVEVEVEVDRWFREIYDKERDKWRYANECALRST